MFSNIHLTTTTTLLEPTCMYVHPCTLPGNLQLTGSRHGQYIHSDESGRVVVFWQQRVKYITLHVLIVNGEHNQVIDRAKHVQHRTRRKNIFNRSTLRVLPTSTPAVHLHLIKICRCEGTNGRGEQQGMVSVHMGNRQRRALPICMCGAWAQPAALRRVNHTEQALFWTRPNDVLNKKTKQIT